MTSQPKRRRRIRRAVFFSSIARRICRLSLPELEALLAYFNANPSGFAPTRTKERAA
ncbi:hypothetical protein D3C86_1941590 [compost metagenome]